jgi:hypothetical protein
VRHVGCGLVCPHLRGLVRPRLALAQGSSHLLRWRTKKKRERKKKPKKKEKKTKAKKKRVKLRPCSPRARTALKKNVRKGEKNKKGKQKTAYTHL